MIIKSIAKGLLKSRAITGMLRGMGGAALAGIGWKMGVDTYEVIKRRLSSSSRKETSSADTRG